VHFDRSPFTYSCERDKGLINFKFGPFIDRFLSDGAASMTVKGLTETGRRGGGRKDIENLGTLLNR